MGNHTVETFQMIKSLCYQIITSLITMLYFIHVLFTYFACSALETEAIPTDSIIEKCMDMTSELGLVFVSQFPNRVEVE